MNSILNYVKFWICFHRFPISICIFINAPCVVCQNKYIKRLFKETKNAYLLFACSYYWPWYFQYFPNAFANRGGPLYIIFFCVNKSNLSLFKSFFFHSDWQCHLYIFSFNFSISIVKPAIRKEVWVRLILIFLWRYLYLDTLSHKNRWRSINWLFPSVLCVENFSLIKLFKPSLFEEVQEEVIMKVKIRLFFHIFLLPRSSLGVASPLEYYYVTIRLFSILKFCPPFGYLSSKCKPNKGLTLQWCDDRRV
jgi:hypothetical protein